MDKLKNSVFYRLKKLSFSVIAKAMSICVAFSNKVMDTRLPLPVGSGDKYDVLRWCRGRLLSICSQFFKYPSSADKSATSPSGGEELHSPWCQKILGTRPRMTGGRDANPLGRSMIEMLGVLAIIAILSVGGIAGYSKAMEKYKLNRTINDYTYVAQNLLEQADSLVKAPSSNITSSLTEVCLAMNIIPSTWRLSRVTNIGKVFADDLGNSVDIFRSGKNLYMEIYLDGINYKSSYSTQVCSTLLRDFVVPLHASLEQLYFWNGGFQDYFYKGDGYASEEYKFIKDMNLAEMQQMCQGCERRCSMVLTFKI